MRIALFLCFLSLVSFSQVDRIRRYSQSPETVTKVAAQPMKFNMDKDTVLVGIYADSLAGRYDVKMYVRFPSFRSVEGYSVVIGFVDGTQFIFEQELTGEHYAEFSIPVSVQIKLKEKRFDYISFDTKGLSEPCTRVRTKDFFTNFLKAL